MKRLLEIDISNEYLERVGASQRRASALQPCTLQKSQPLQVTDTLPQVKKLNQEALSTKKRLQQSILLQLKTKRDLQRVELVRRQCQDLKLLHEQLQAQLYSQEGANAACFRQVNSLKMKINQRITEYNILRTRSQRHIELQDKCQRLESRWAMLAERLRSQQLQLQGIKGVLQRYLQSNNGQRGRVCQLESSVAKMSSSLFTINRQKGQLTAQLDSKLSKFSQAQQSLSVTQQMKLQQLSIQVQAAQSIFDQNTAKLEKRHQSFYKNQSKAAEIERLIEMGKQEIAGLNEQLLIGKRFKKAQEQLKKAEARLAKLKTENASLQQQISGEKQLTIEIVNQIQLANSQQSAMQSQQESLNKHIKQLTQKVAQFQLLISRLGHQKKDLQLQAKEKSAKFQYLQPTASLLSRKNEATQLQQQIKRLRSELDSKEKAKTQLFSDIQKNLQQVARLRPLIKEAKNQGLEIGLQEEQMKRLYQKFYDIISNEEQQSSDQDQFKEAELQALLYKIQQLSQINQNLKKSKSRAELAVQREADDIDEKQAKKRIRSLQKEQASLRQRLSQLGSKQREELAERKEELTMLHQAQVNRLRNQLQLSKRRLLLQDIQQYNADQDNTNSTDVASESAQFGLADQPGFHEF